MVLLTVAAGEDHDRTMDAISVPGRALAKTAGLILLGFGLLFVTYGVALSMRRPEGDFDLGPAIALFALTLGLPPLLAGIGILRDHRSAKVIGIVVGLLYGIVAVGQGTRQYGQSILATFGLAFLLAAVLLIDSFRRSAAR